MLLESTWLGAILGRGWLFESGTQNSWEMPSIQDSQCYPPSLTRWEKSWKRVAADKETPWGLWAWTRKDTSLIPWSETPGSVWVVHDLKVLALHNRVLTLLPTSSTDLWPDCVPYLLEWVGTWFSLNITIDWGKQRGLWNRRGTLQTHRPEARQRKLNCWTPKQQIPRKNKTCIQK